MITKNGVVKTSLTFHLESISLENENSVCNERNTPSPGQVTVTPLFAR
jgi:hypothetical protein